MIWDNEAGLRKRQWQQMHQGHQGHPARIGEPLDPFTRVPNRSMAGRQIARVGHRDHRIVEEHKIAFAVDHKAGPLNEAGRIEQEEDDEGRKYDL